MSAFIDRHGDGRFSDAVSDSDIRDRAGWWRDDESGRVYLFTAEGMRDALKGFDFKRALDTLQESGALPPPSQRRARQAAANSGRPPVRLYEINLNNLGASDGT